MRSSTAAGTQAATTSAAAVEDRGQVRRGDGRREPGHGGGEPLHFATAWEAIADRIPAAPALSHGARTTTWAHFEERDAAPARRYDTSSLLTPLLRGYRLECPRQGAPARTRATGRSARLLRLHRGGHLRFPAGAAGRSSLHRQLRGGPGPAGDRPGPAGAAPGGDRAAGRPNARPRATTRIRSAARSPSSPSAASISRRPATSAGSRRTAA